MSGLRKRVRISAPPGVCTVIKQYFPKVANATLVDTADTAASMCAAAGVPLTRPVLEHLCSAAATPQDVSDALKASLEQMPDGKRRSELLLPSRKFTIYSLLEASTPEQIRSKAADRVPMQQRVAVTIGTQILTLVAGKHTAGAKDPFTLAVRNSDKFEFNLRQEAYCHRRFITDRALQRLARTNPGLAATHVYADSFGMTLRSRPKIDTAPYFFAAYYDFFQKNPEHFESLDVVSEVLSVTGCDEFRRLAAGHHANYIEQRDRWQDARTTQLQLPKNQYVDPALYTRRAGSRGQNLTTQATQLVAASRTAKARIVDVAVSKLPDTSKLKQKQKANEKAWHDAIA